MGTWHIAILQKHELNYLFIHVTTVNFTFYSKLVGDNIPYFHTLFTCASDKNIIIIIYHHNITYIRTAHNIIVEQS